jgi:hypothetical protein
MPLNKLENVKRQYPKMSKQIDDLFEYLSEQQRNGVTDYLPKLAAVKLGISEATALGLLTAFEEAGLVAHEYHVLCRSNHALIASVNSLSELEDSYECEDCGEEHGENDVKVELVFRPAGLGGNLEHAA